MVDFGMNFFLMGLYLLLCFSCLVVEFAASGVCCFSVDGDVVKLFTIVLESSSGHILIMRFSIGWELLFAEAGLSEV